MRNNIFTIIFVLYLKVHVLASEGMRKQFVFPGQKDQTAKSIQEFLGVGLKSTQAQVLKDLTKHIEYLTC